MKKIMMVAIVAMSVAGGFANHVYVSVVQMDGVACGYIGTHTEEKYDEVLYKDAMKLKQKIPHNLKTTSWAIELSKKLIDNIKNTPKEDVKKIDSLRMRLNYIKRQAKMNGVKV